MPRPIKKPNFNADKLQQELIEAVAMYYNSPSLKLPTAIGRISN